jgi:AcrR family transcriptional regulator
MSDTVRDQILEWAIDELAVNGSEFFRTTQLCSELHISRSLINHHFGSHLGLIAEACVVSYERYVHVLKDAAVQHDTPLARLEAWMSAQHDWFVTHRGTAALLQLPHPNYAQAMSNHFSVRLKHAFRFTMTVLATLVRDVQDGVVTPIDFDTTSAPFTELLSQSMETLMRTASVGMSSLGASVWAAGHTMPSRDIDEGYLQDASLTQHRKWVTRAILALA